MTHPIRALACAGALLAAIAMTACGGRQTMASRSAAALDEATKKGSPVSAGDHGGHSAGHEAPASDVAGTSQATMPGMDTSAMAGMDHAKMIGMQHGSSATSAHDMAGMKHGTSG
ncbi:MAG: hypothetical protein ABI779_09405, partial [Acidobacteriota bacterium]